MKKNPALPTIMIITSVLLTTCVTDNMIEITPVAGLRIEIADPFIPDADGKKVTGRVNTQHGQNGSFENFETDDFGMAALPGHLDGTVEIHTDQKLHRTVQTRFERNHTHYYATDRFEVPFDTPIQVKVIVEMEDEQYTGESETVIIHEGADPQLITITLTREMDADVLCYLTQIWYTDDWYEEENGETRNHVVFHYDENQRLTGWTEGNYEARITYDGDGRISRLEDYYEGELDYVTTYSWSSDHVVAESEEAQYDDYRSRIMANLNAAGKVVYFEQSDYNNETETWDEPYLFGDVKWEAGNVTRIDYSWEFAKRAQIISEADALRSNTSGLLQRNTAERIAAGSRESSSGESSSIENSSRESREKYLTESYNVTYLYEDGLNPFDVIGFHDILVAQIYEDFGVFASRNTVSRFTEYDYHQTDITYTYNEYGYPLTATWKESVVDHDDEAYENTWEYDYVCY